MCKTGKNLSQQNGFHIRHSVILMYPLAVLHILYNKQMSTLRVTHKLKLDSTRCAKKEIWDSFLRTMRRYSV